MKTARLLLVSSLMVLLVQVARAEDKPAADAKAVRPFNGKSLDGWKTKDPKERSKWTVGKAGLSENNPQQLTVADAGTDLVNADKSGVDIYTLQEFGDCTINVEIMVPKDSNSGIYVMGEYEVQILDSFGKAQVGPGDIGGLYGAAAPRENAAKKPGEWQKFVIEFQAPKFEGDKKISNAVFKKVSLNGKVIHEDVEMKGPTPSGITGKERATGPLMFQGDHGPVAIRNLEIVTP
jgi:hypothetical protein